MLRYKAFISYNRAVDAGLAAAVQKVLQSFSRLWYRPLSFRIFLDKASVAPSEDAFRTVRAAIDQSEHLILLASVKARESPWVGREIEYWLATGHSHRDILIVFTEGEDLAWNAGLSTFVSTSGPMLPSALDGVFSAEPSYVDMRWARSAPGALNMKDARFADAIADLSAAVQHRWKDEVIGQEHRQRLLLRGAISLAVVGILTASVAAMWQYQTATVQRDQAYRLQSLFLAASSRRETEAGLSTLGVLLALEGLPKSSTSTDRPFVPEAEVALYRALISNHEKAILDGHSGEVTDVAIDPGGEFAVSVGLDGTVRRWSLVGMMEKSVLFDAGAWLLKVRVDAGKRIFAADVNGQVHVWDQSLRGRIAAQGGPISALSVGRSGSNLLTVSAGTPPKWQSAIFSQAAEGEFGPEAADMAVLEVATGNVVTASAAKLAFWDVNWRALRQSVTLPEPVTALAIGTASVLAAGTESGKIHLWSDTWKGGSPKAVALAPASVRTLLFHPDGKQLFAGLEDGSIHVFDSASGGKSIVLRGHGDAVTSMDVDTLGRQLISGSRDGTVRVWALSTRSESGVVLARKSSNENRAVCGDDGRHIALATRSNELSVLDLDAGKVVSTLRLREGVSILNIGIDRSGARVVLLAEEDRSKTCCNAAIYTWRVGDTAGAVRVPLPDVSVSNSSFSDDLRHLYIEPYEVPIAAEGWQVDTATGKVLRTFAPASSWISPDETTYVAADQSGTVNLYDLQTQQPVGTLLGHSRWINRAAFSRDGKLLVTASGDGTARVWDVGTRALRQTIQGTEERMEDATFSFSGKRLMTYSYDQNNGLDNARVSVWNVTSGQELETIWSGNKVFAKAVLCSNSERVAVWPEGGAMQLVRLLPEHGLIDAARANAPRRLTQQERARFFVGP